MATATTASQINDTFNWSNHNKITCVVRASHFMREQSKGGMAVNPGFTQKTGRIVQEFTGNGRMVNIKVQENQRKKS